MSIPWFFPRFLFNVPEGQSWVREIRLITVIVNQRGSFGWSQSAWPSESSEFITWAREVIVPRVRLVTGWFVSGTMQKPHNQFPQNLDGGFVLKQNRPH